MNKHTPGPWKMLVGSEYCFHDTTRVSIVAEWKDSEETGESTVAEVWPGSNDTDIRDGALIAAAPDLLVRLGALIEESENALQHAIECGDDGAVLWHDLRDALYEGRAAIAKAEGREN